MIIHRLSLRLWGPDQGVQDGPGSEMASDQTPIDPLASPAEGSSSEPAADYMFDSFEPSSSTCDVHRPDMPSSLFSQRNLIRLAALANSHRTLSLFTPSIHDAVFRAWAGASERGDGSGANTPATPLSSALSPQTYALSRAHSNSGSVSGYSGFTGSQSQQSDHQSRPSLTPFHSTLSGLSLANMRHHHHHHHHARGHAGARKGKARVVNLRRKMAVAGENPTNLSVSAEAGTTELSSSMTSWSDQSMAHGREDELVTPPTSPKSKNQQVSTRSERRVLSPSNRQGSLSPSSSAAATAATAGVRSSPPCQVVSSMSAPSRAQTRTDQETSTDRCRPENLHIPLSLRSVSVVPISSGPSSSTAKAKGYLSEKSASTSPSNPFKSTGRRSDDEKNRTRTDQRSYGILERAWLAKLANEVGGLHRRHCPNLHGNGDGNGNGGGLLAMGVGHEMDRTEQDQDEEDGPPPAYELR